jgi:hypothetical protein
MAPTRNRKVEVLHVISRFAILVLAIVSVVLVQTTKAVHRSAQTIGASAQRTALPQNSLVRFANAGSYYSGGL